MSNSVQNTNGTEQVMEHEDTPMESPEKAGKGKGKVAEEMPVDDDEDDGSEEDVENDGEVEEPDEDNMEEIDTDNIVNARTRGKHIDYAEAAKQLDPEDDEDDEEDEDFEDEDDKMED